MNIQEKIKDYQLISLFPTSVYLREDKLDVTDNTINFFAVRKKVSLAVLCLIVFKKKDGKYDCSMRYLITEGEPNEPPTKERDVVQLEVVKNNLPEVLNAFNEFYHECAEKFNKILTDELKKELEKAKEEQKKKEEEEKQKQEEEEQNKGEDGEQGENEDEGEDGEQGENEDEGEDGEQGEGEGEDGEQGEGEDEDGEQGEGEDGEQGEQGEGEGQGQGQGQGEMSSEEIQKMIDEIQKSQSGENQEGQSQSGSDNIDLEDFLNEVENGYSDNDFTKNYNNQSLKQKIDEEREQDEKEDEKGQSSSGKRQDEPKYYDLRNVLDAIQQLLEISSDEVKRRFSSKKSITGFITRLNKNEIDEIANNIGLPQEISLSEKQKEISKKLAEEINI